MITDFIYIKWVVEVSQQEYNGNIMALRKELDEIGGC